VRLFDWLAPRRQCVVLGCTERPNGRSALCVTHARELNEKIKRAVERVRQTPAMESRR
jgi:hypothetical protein